MPSISERKLQGIEMIVQSPHLEMRVIVQGSFPTATNMFGYNLNV